MSSATDTTHCPYAFAKWESYRPLLRAFRTAERYPGCLALLPPQKAVEKQAEVASGVNNGGGGYEREAWPVAQPGVHEEDFVLPRHSVEVLNQEENVDGL